jgi:hypothetical protein
MVRHRPPIRRRKPMAHRQAVKPPTDSRNSASDGGGVWQLRRPPLRRGISSSAATQRATAPRMTFRRGTRRRRGTARRPAGQHLADASMEAEEAGCVARCNNRSVEPLSLVGRAVFDVGRDVLQRRRRVRVRTHDAVFDGSNELCLMVNVVNLGQRPITLTHVWFDVMPPLHVLNEARPLPKMLQPDEPWETWVRLSDFGSRLMSLDERQLRRSARVRISTGQTIKARPNRDVPARGTVPGAEQ